MKLFDIFKKKKPAQQEAVPNKKKKVELDKEMNFPGVEKFDEDRYLADTFEEVKKNNIEKSMAKIRNALGKDVLRDSKIDMLLNSDEE